MKRIIVILICLAAVYACDNGYLASDSKEELVVEGWIENGHAPIVYVSSTLPVSSDPKPLSGISEHVLRYAEVYIDCDGVRHYLTAALTDMRVLQSYFTSSDLRGETGKTYKLCVKWLDYEASAICTIPEPVPIDTAWFEKQRDDSSYVAKLQFTNNPSEGKYYQSFLRSGPSGEDIFRSVNFSSLNGRLIDEKVTETFMKPMLISSRKSGNADLYFHKGDIAAVKLATMEKPMYDFWTSFTNSYNGSSLWSAPSNLKGNVDGAIGYWAGYGISMTELVCQN